MIAVICAKQLRFMVKRIWKLFSDKDSFHLFAYVEFMESTFSTQEKERNRDGDSPNLLLNRLC